jgi:uncharacterized protein (DUF2236 family)
MTDFVARDSIVRDLGMEHGARLLGCAAEFAQPRGRLAVLCREARGSHPPALRNASYAQQIVFADELTASAAFDRIRAVHGSIERQRGEPIPDWAHRDVLYMLIDYSERAHELLIRPLSGEEQVELYDVFNRVGTGLQIPDLPLTYTEWRADRERHLRRDLLYSDGTRALYAQYPDHLGLWRYDLLLQIQAVLVPEHVRDLLGLKSAEWLRPLARVYPFLVRAGFRSMIQSVLMPSRYLTAVRSLDHLAPHPRSRPARTMHTPPSAAA